MKKMYTIAVKVEGNLYLPFNDNSVYADKSRKKVKREMEVTYNNKHKQGYEGSMSACIHMIQFQPHVITIPAEESAIMELLEPSPNGNGRVQPIKLSSPSGRMIVLKFRDELVEQLLSTSTQPDLISEDLPGDNLF